MRKPIIGILGNTYKTQPGLFSSAERMYVNSDYIEGVLNNGGIPMAIPAVAMKADPEGILAATFFTSSLRRVFTAAGSFLPGRGATSISIWGNFFSSMLLSHPPVSGRSGPPRISASIIPDGPPLGKYGPSGTAAHTLDCGHDPRN